MRATSQGRHGRLAEQLQRDVVAGIERGLLAQRVHDVTAEGNITIDGRKLVNFGSCSYLGLYDHPALRAAAIAGIERFGVSFSSSRMYAALPYYQDLEDRLATIMGGPAIAAGSTTLGHLAALPAIISGNDIILIDRQAHASLHLATQVLAGRGVAVQPVPHADTGQLETAIDRYGRIHDRVWYVADGVYSAFGDIGPNGAVIDLLDRHPNLYAYIDDAHGFGWAGRHGRGVAMADRAMHPKLVLAISLSKAFGAGGGAIVAGDPDLAGQIMLRGGPLMFGGPIQTAELAAGVAAADLLLSDEHELLRQRMAHQIDQVTEGARTLRIPMSTWDPTPIWFVHVGPLDGARELARRILDDGYWVNLSGFPVVPFGRAGVRFTHTLAQDSLQIEGLLRSIARHLPEVGAAELTVDLAELESAG